MTINDDARGRKNSSHFKLVFGPAFHAEWLNATWLDSPSKAVITPMQDVVFFGLLDASARTRRGFLLTSDDALGLGQRLHQHGILSQGERDKK